MTDMRGDFVVQTAPDTIELQRLLPGPIERVWAYLTENDLRRRWLAAGEMGLQAGMPFELTWRNDELTDPPGSRPDGFSTEHKATMQMVEVDPPRRLTFTWPETGEVTFALDPQGDEVLFTITHRRAPTPRTVLGVSSGWHAHLDVLDALLREVQPAPFWDRVATLRAAYEGRLSG